MNKKTKPSQIINGVEIANSLGIGFYSAFIYGDPAETPDTIRESMDFFSKHLLDTHIYSAAISPYPGSKLFDDCLKNGIIRDKPSYYEHIDEELFNMTAIPNRLWFPWAYLVIYLWRYFQFVKVTDALSYSIDETAANDPIAKYYNQAVFKVSAICPHCSEEGMYREILTDNKVANKPPKRPSLSSIGAFIRRILGLGVNKYNVPKVMVKGGLLFLFSFKNSIYKTLMPLLGDHPFEQSFTTGCQHCNKRIKIRIPVGTAVSGFNNIRKILLKMI
jgi:hypothetical protein